MWDIVTAAGIIITAVTIVPVILQLRNHPRGLYVLFFAEMWERFSYYGMRGILLAYMTQHFLFNDAAAQGQYGAYASLVYLMPMLGGLLADRFLGTRKAIAFGALLLVAGHFAMAIEQKPAVQTLTYQGQTYEFAAEGRQDARETWLVVEGERYTVGADKDGALTINDLPSTAPLPNVLPKGSYELAVMGRDPVFTSIFYLAMSLIIMGVGFLKANISTIVGQLYPQEDPRRDSGFTLYYYGINLGAFWASILCAGLGAKFGWWAGFGLAGIGMAAGFVVFVLGKPLLEGKGEPPDAAVLKQKAFGPLTVENSIYAAGLLGVLGVWWLVQREAVVNWALLLVSIAALVYFIVYMIKRCTAVEAQRIILALVLIAAATIFWTLFELAGSALNQFAERSTDLTLIKDAISLGPIFIGTEQQLSDAGLAAFGAPAADTIPRVLFVEASITSGQTQSFNAGIILIGAPIFAALWAFLEKRRRDPNDVLKFALALVQVGAGYLVLVWGAAYADENFRVPLIFLFLLYVLHTTGELCLSPVGLSAMTKLAPAAIASTVMATWFLSSSAAQALGAQIAKFTAAETVGGQVLDRAAALATYVSVFQQIGWGAIVIGVALGLASPWLHKLAHRAH